MTPKFQTSKYVQVDKSMINLQKHIVLSSPIKTCKYHLIFQSIFPNSWNTVLSVIFSSTSAASFDSAPRSSSLWHRGMGIRKEMLILYHEIQHTCIYIICWRFLIKWSQMCGYGVSSCQLNLALPSLFVRVLKHIRPQRVRFLLRIAGHSWLPQWHRAERLRVGCKKQAVKMWIYSDICMFAICCELFMNQHRICDDRFNSI